MNFFLLKLLGFTFCVTFCTLLVSQTTPCGWRLQNSIHKDVSGFSALQQYLLKQEGTLDADSLYILPVVVHVIHTGTPVGSADNPDNSHILQMLATLNKAWRKNGVAYGGADMKIQFQLAVRSPACGATNGINRVNGGNIANYVSGGITNYNNPSSAPEEIVKNLSRWPNTDYINIWIVNKINGDSLFPGGYAYFPEYNSALTDGIVLNASVVDSANKTIVHEMGHVFSLYHTFADGGFENTCAANADCNTQGDLICDTEPHLLETSCSSPRDSCTGNPYVITDAVHGYTVLNNYMGYTNCQWMFTENQKTRVRATLFAFRHSLISSGALSAATALSTAAACVPTATFGLSPYYGVQQVDFNTLNVYSNSSKADGNGYVDRTCNQQTTVTKGQLYPLSITGSYLNPHRIRAFIDYNNDGDFDDAGESILTGYQGMASKTVFIPFSGVATGQPLRLRVIADNPALPQPTACQLHGTNTEGAGQVEDFAVIIEKRKIFSIASGAWNNTATWSCHCVPQGDDEVTIKSPHTVSLTPAMGAMQCGNVLLEAGCLFNINGNLMAGVSN